MKILAVVHAYLPGTRAGAEKMLHSLLVSLVREGHEVHVSVTRDDPAPTLALDGVKIHRGVDLRKSDARWDLVVTQLMETQETIRWSRAPVAVVAHSDHPWIRDDLSLQPELVVCNTLHVQESLDYSRSIKCRPSLVPEHYAATTRGDAVTLVNLSREKGSKVFYDVARRLPRVKFLGVEGGYGVQEFKDRDNVSIQPNTVNMRDDVFSKTKLLLMPSHHESFGMVGTEAQCSGIPVIATDLPGTREALSTGAIYIDSLRPEDWAERVLDLMWDETLYRDLSLAATRCSKEAREQSAKDLSLWVDSIERIANRS